MVYMAISPVLTNFLRITGRTVLRLRGVKAVVAGYKSRLRVTIFDRAAFGDSTPIVYDSYLQKQDDWYSL